MVLSVHSRPLDSETVKFGFDEDSPAKSPNLELEGLILSRRIDKALFTAQDNG
jgi:hypothetical protein